MIAGEARNGGAFAALDVAVGRAGPGGADADGDEAVGFGGGFQGIVHDGVIGIGIADELVGGEDHHHGIRIASGDQADSEGYGGGGVALGGLCEDVFRWQHGGDLAHGLYLLGVGEDEDVFERDQAFETADGLLEQGAGAEEIEKLLWFVVATERPKTGAGSTGENESVSIIR